MIFEALEGRPIVFPSAAALGQTTSGSGEPRVWGPWSSKGSDRWALGCKGRKRGEGFAFTSVLSFCYILFKQNKYFFSLCLLPLVIDQPMETAEGPK